ncbi:unnamed protein product [Gongylonema pulchrum]|uniref:Calsyntenin-1 n=1 Tax=Gongylonema pulchrum TaxID=637853 RepID=A0A183DS54_9BILA|nr:unnamed protein product [Gongylonema pulchrum]
MHAAATAAQAAKRGKLRFDDSRYLPPPDALPRDPVTEVMKSVDLPHLDRQQTQIIRDYHTSRLPTDTDLARAKGSPAERLRSVPSKMTEMMQMLPPGYNISEIPKSVVDALFRGETNKTMEEILHSLPTFERPIMPTYVPYDINDVSNDFTQVNQQAEKLVRVQYYTALLLGFVGAVSLAVLSLICIYIKRKRLVDTEPDIDEDSLVDPTQMAHTRQTAPGTPKMNQFRDQAKYRRHPANV